MACGYALLDRSDASMYAAHVLSNLSCPLDACDAQPVTQSYRHLLIGCGNILSSKIEKIHNACIKTSR